MPNDLLEVVLAILATYRVAQLISVDEGPAGVFQRFRVWSGNKSNERGGVWSHWADLVRCPWCVGVWIALPIALLLTPAGLFEFGLLWFGIAGGQAFLETMEGNRYDGSE